GLRLRDGRLGLRDIGRRATLAQLREIGLGLCYGRLSLDQGARGGVEQRIKLILGGLERRLGLLDAGHFVLARGVVGYLRLRDRILGTGKRGLSLDEGVVILLA